MKFKSVLLWLAPLILIFFSSESFKWFNRDGGNPPPNFRKTWVDSEFYSMTPDQRIGQLFMVAAFSNSKYPERVKLAALIAKYNIGGLIFFQGGPVRQAKLTNYYQTIAKIPLLIGQDAEWGLSMRLDSTIEFPHQIALGSIQNDTLIYEMGKEIARECKRIGVNIDFAPDVDINSNPDNPVINDRSFGEDRNNVMTKGLAYMLGLQDNGVMACAKHFPGHGSTDKDSHLTLPTVSASHKELDSIELYPFIRLIAAGVKGVMVAHLSVKALDSTGIPTTLSKLVVTGLLKDNFGFKGLTFTDALNMKGVSDSYPPGTVDAKALLAGNDMLLFPQDVPTAILKIKEAIADSEITQADIDLRVRKILEAKYWCGLNHFKRIETKNIYSDLNTADAELLKRKLIENSLTIVNNANNQLPLSQLDTLKIASLMIGADKESSFERMLSNYDTIAHYQITKNIDSSTAQHMLDTLSHYNLVIVGLEGMVRQPAKQFGITGSTISFLNRLNKRTNVCLTVFGNPYALKNFETIPLLIQAYSSDSDNQQLAAQLIFGGIPAKGKLSVSASASIHEGRGIFTQKIRLKYTMPEEVGIDGEKLSKKIDSIVNYSIKEYALPGCQVMVAKDGKVILQKSYGYFTYDKTRPVKNSDIYDLASVTKIAATTLGIMKLYESNQINLTQKISFYLPDLNNTNKADIKVAEVMTHTAGLKPYEEFFKFTLDAAGNPDPKYYSKTEDAQHQLHVADSLWLINSYPDSIWQYIINSTLHDRGEYVYSDFSFIIMKRIFETLTHQTLDLYTENVFYKPMGLQTMWFKPLQHESKDNIVPTADDKLFRKQLLDGYVHDPTAAMFGGVCGHAGLFSDANDLTALMQMLLNGGSYGGRQYFKPATVKLFTQKYYDYCRRGLGFDKPETIPGKASPCISDVSAETYGHQGFTGTVVWVDPEYNLIFTFLSNRVYPDEENRKILTLGIREKIHQAIYDAILNK
jgi:beta-N-acetylhexosaminidase